MLYTKDDYYYAYTWETLRLIYFDKCGNKPMAKVLFLLAKEYKKKYNKKKNYFNH